MRGAWMIGACVGLAGAAAADITTSLQPVPNGLGAGSLTYDLMVHVSGGDDWTSTSIKAELDGATFYHHPNNGNNQPNPQLFPSAPLLQWDTFFTTPEGWPNTPEQGVFGGYAGAHTWAPKAIDATWFDTPPNGGGGDYVIVRMSLVDIEPGWTLAVSGAHSTVKGLSQLFPYNFVIPEPGTILSMAFCLTVLAGSRGAREWWVRRRE